MAEYDFNIPGIINPKNPVNANQRVIADEFGRFELPISEPYSQSSGFPDVQVMISRANTRDNRRILFDKAGVLAEERIEDNGKKRLWWSNKATSDHGYLLRRGTYRLDAFIDGKLSTTRFITSQSHAIRPDWEDYS